MGPTGIKRTLVLLFAGSLLSAESQQRKSIHFTYLENRLQDYSCKAKPKSKYFKKQTKRASSVVRVAGRECDHNRLISNNTECIEPEDMDFMKDMALSSWQHCQVQRTYLKCKYHFFFLRKILTCFIV